ncbi:MHYT domain-containing protein, NO-binding membrane sensor [Nocardia farcinica]|uniref:MHYT domain (Predicted integral membrane sensor domain) n=1 Tax=Nocardia farcinica TaxID=37329 RepID=A0A0H5NQI1_NOCFR|nr:MHYT domain-containing protein [Nocardia farcinica]AXK85713.1 signal protein [Nocardia farcinica]CRY77552.1 MHYT domain (predicted integral membrane sensor domain) [Nocardia farcinica]SIT31319.1 MHYT domain-containing protein, NO-binding membrane sensor [Nocardia farcinica]
MHHHVHHFEMGAWLMWLAYLVSVIGSIVGLAAARRSLSARTDGQRLGWLWMSAVAIGGVGIWLMHFIAMLGFAVPGVPLRYDMTWTAGSAVLAIVAVFAGLLVVGTSVSAPRLLAGGLITGLAVNIMHYAGMNAVRFQGEIHYNRWLVALSVLIAVVAATVALLFTLILDSVLMRLLGGLVMGVAVVGMHYTGMAAVSVTVDQSIPVPEGAEVFSFLFPVFVMGLLGLAVPITVLLISDPDDLAAPEPV